MKTRKELFEKLRKIKETDRVLLLTHDDMDGAGAEIVLKALLPEGQVSVRHFDNGSMSQQIYKILLDDIVDKYDMVIACDISTREHDSEFINSLANIEKFIMLDHHLTSLYINQYEWGVSCSEKPHDSFLNWFYQNAAKNSVKHSSGTSLLLDYMEYCNFKLDLYSRNVLHQIACFISAYDTWDWKTCLSGKQIFNDYNLLFSAYGNDEFVKSMLSKIADYRSNEWNDFDKRLLAIEKKKRAEHVRRIATNIRFGFWDIPYNTSKIKEYSIAYIEESKYIFDIFDYMRETYPEIDLFIINYGTGISIRSDKENINVGKIVKTFGGGGHKGSGGFKLSKEKIQDCIEERTGTKFFFQN